MMSGLPASFMTDFSNGIGLILVNSIQNDS